jgi:4-hydroxybenzoate polyprenyltransferase
MSTLSQNQKLSAWLQLLRPPNLFTVPGDVVAGYGLVGIAAASTWSADIVVLVAASLCIYAAGLILNDWFDLDRDRAERPERPLPSGRIAPHTAFLVGLLLLAAGPVLAVVAGPHSFLAALLLAALVFLYDARAKQNSRLGPATMGLCRAANVMLGASVAFGRLDVPLLVAVLVEGGYIVLLTAAAARETGSHLSRTRALAPIAFLTLGLGAFLFCTGPTPAVLAGTAAVLLYPVYAVLDLQTGVRQNIPKYIGRLVRSLIPLQAAFVLAAPALRPLAVPVILLLPLSVIAAREYSGS